MTLNANLRENSGPLKELGVVVPGAIKFATPKQGPPGTRKEFRLAPAASSYSTSTENIVRFYFNNSNLIDFSRGSVAFNVTLTTTGPGTYVRLAQGVWSIFNRARLTTGTELEDVREYNRLHSLLWETHRDPNVGAILGEVIGFGTQSQRDGWGATAGKNYAMPLLVGPFLTGVMPMGLFSQRLQLELYMEDPRRCIETDHTSVVISLTQIYFHYEVLGLKASTEMMVSSAASSTLQYPYKSFTFYQQPVLTSANDYLIPHSSDGIDAFINVMVQSNNQTDMTANNKFITWLNNGAVQKQLRINNEYFPMEPTQFVNDPQGYIEYLRWIGKWKIGGVYANPPTISFEEYKDNRFIMVDNLEAYPTDGLVNNFSTATGGNNVFLRLNLATAPVTPSTLMTWVQTSKMISFIGSKFHAAS